MRTISYQLLMPANSQYLFRFYQDCYHWNVWFEGIEQSWLEQEPQVGVSGKVNFKRGGSWHITIAQLHDDRVITFKARRWWQRASMEIELEAVRSDMTVVTHTLQLRGISGWLCKLVWGRALQRWLQHNLYTLMHYVEIYQAEQSKRKDATKPRRTTRKKAGSRKPAKNQQTKTASKKAVSNKTANTKTTRTGKARTAKKSSKAPAGTAN